MPSPFAHLRGWLRKPPARKSVSPGAMAAFSGAPCARWTPRHYAALVREGYQLNPVGHRAVRLIAEAAASVQWLLYQDRTELTDHPLLQLFAVPNPLQGRAAFFETLYGQLLVAGNVYLEAPAVDGVPRELHLLRPDRVSIVTGADGWPEGYDYSVGGQTTRFMQDADDFNAILHLKLFHPLDDHYGLSPLEAAATAWVPQSKPIYLTELGFPAVDRGSNQPNVFVDPKSSESALPYYSRGTRDDLIQRRALEAVIGHWTDPAKNPVSSVYGGRMLDMSRAHVWCWDARSFPDFPSRAAVWTDAENWRLGHWLNGRVGLVPLADLVSDLCAYAGFAAIDAAGLSGLVTGFLIDHTMSVRDALEPLMLTYQFDARESEGLIKFAHRGGAPAARLTEDDLVLDDGNEPKSGFTLTRAQETDLPLASRLTYIDATADYRQSAIESRRLVGNSDRTAVSTVPLVMEQGFAQGVSDMLLMEAWVKREQAGFTLPPSRLALDASDILSLEAGGRDWRLRLTGIGDSAARKMSAERTDPSIYDFVTGPERAFTPEPVTTFGAPLGVFLDLPILSADAAEHAPYFAAYAAPWPGQVLLYRAAGSSGFSLDAVAEVPSRMGATDGAFYSGPLWRFDRVNDLYVTLIAGTAGSKSEADILNGANALALQNADGAWEILQFETAALIGPRSYRLSGLLRGLGGTESAMRDPVAAGARVVFLDNALVQPGFSFDQRTLTFTYRYGPAGAAFSDPSYVQETRGFQALGLRPFAPTRLRGRRNAASGDWTVTWIRRTRIGGDDWDQTEVPLGETSEAYDLEIYDVPGTTLKRSVSVTSPSFAYTAAQQTADFGAAQWNFTARVYQKSDAFGRGPGTQALIWHY